MSIEIYGDTTNVPGLNHSFLVHNGNIISGGPGTPFIQFTDHYLLLPLEMDIDTPFSGSLDDRGEGYLYIISK
jgi:hypothetical protein